MTVQRECLIAVAHQQTSLFIVVESSCLPVTLVDAGTIHTFQVAVEALPVILLDQLGVDLLVDFLRQAVHFASY